MKERSRTIAEHLEYLYPGLSRRKNPPAWPPDIFGLSASLLVSSGAYRVAAGNWPPNKNPESWVPLVRRVAKSWRKSFAFSAPKEVKRWWKQLIANKNLKLADLCGDVLTCHAILQLLSASDEASAGAGIPSPPKELDDFDFAAGALLRQNAGESLAQELLSAPFKILPKMHAPQSGLTIRSFSHHLAFIVGNEIRPRWYTVPPMGNADTLRLLLVPWPLKLKTSDFSAVPKKRAVMRNLPPKYGFFEFAHQNAAKFPKKVIDAYQAASKATGKIDAVVLPECAINDAEYDQINSYLLSQGVYLIAGIGGPRIEDGSVSNCVRYNLPVAVHDVPIRQTKHHRWRLDGSQIRNYRLGSTLNERKVWWEHIPIEDRTLTFVAFQPWLAMCALICEDLARPDPVGDIIRAIGPNLVVSLLLDGPQLPDRWPGRYATILADDPGCSVLTLTCEGMSTMSRPPHKRGWKKNSRIVASWKDVRGKVIGIDLGKGDSVVLGIEIEKREEWTADGRSDGKEAGYPLLRTVRVLNGRRTLRRYRIST